MPIVDTDLKKYAAANRPEDDTSASGGAIDTSCVLDVTQMGATSALEALSSNAADTMNLTITGRDAGGTVVPEVRALNGTTVVSFVTNTLERFLKAVLAAAPAGNVTIRLAGGGATVAVIPAGKTKASILFIGSTSEGSPTTRVEKEFWKNEHATLALTSAQLALTADPSASVRIAVETAKNDTNSVANRKATPAGVTFVDDGVNVNVPGTQLEAGSAIGVWVELKRIADAAAIKSSYTTSLSGVTV